MPDQHEPQLTHPIATVPEHKHTKQRKMGYEDSVYLAKLAEQAERYEGKWWGGAIRNLGYALISFQKWSRT